MARVRFYTRKVYVVAAVRIKREDWALKCEDLKLSFGWLDPPCSCNKNEIQYKEVFMLEIPPIEAHKCYFTGNVGRHNIGYQPSCFSHSLVNNDATLYYVR